MKESTCISSSCIQKHFAESLAMISMSLLPIVVALSVMSFTVVAGRCPGAGRNTAMEAACREACGTPAAASEE